MPKPKKVLDHDHAKSASVKFKQGQQLDAFDLEHSKKKTEKPSPGRPRKAITRESLTHKVSANLDKEVYDKLVVKSLERGLIEKRKIAVSEVMNDLLRKSLAD